MVKIGPLLTKLRPGKVNNHLFNQVSPLCTGFRTYVKTLHLHINKRRFSVHKEKRPTLNWPDTWLQNGFGTGSWGPLTLENML